MKNKISVMIGGQEYTMVAVENEEYVKQCAAHVDEQLKELNDARLSLADCAVLTAMNIADEYFKEKEAAAELRVQYKASLEEASALKLELSEAKREIFKLQSHK